MCIHRRVLFFFIGFFLTLFIGWYGGVDIFERGDAQAVFFAFALMFGGIGFAVENMLDE